MVCTCILLQHTPWIEQAIKPLTPRNVDIGCQTIKCISVTCLLGARLPCVLTIKWTSVNVYLFYNIYVGRKPYHRTFASHSTCPCNLSPGFNLKLTVRPAPRGRDCIIKIFVPLVTQQPNVSARQSYVVVKSYVILYVLNTMQFTPRLCIIKFICSTIELGAHATWSCTLY